MSLSCFGTFQSLEFRLSSHSIMVFRSAVSLISVNATLYYLFESRIRSPTHYPLSLVPSINKDLTTISTEALALLQDCKASRLAALTKSNSSATHLLAPPPSSASAEPVRTIESATIVRIVRHSTLISVPSEQYQSPEQLQRPALMTRNSSGSILKNREGRGLSAPAPPPVSETGRRGSRKGSAVSWTAPSLGQISEGVVDNSGADAPVGETEDKGPLHQAPPVMKRVRTKVFRCVSWSSGEEEYEEILMEGDKQVIFIWGNGVDDIIP